MKNWLTDRLVPLHVRRLIRQKHYEEALNVLTSDAGANLPSPYALANAAYCHCQLGHYEEALGLLDQVLQAKPDYAWAHAHVARCYKELGRDQEALESLTRAVRIDKDSRSKLHDLGAWLQHLGCLQAKLGDPEKATESFEAAIKIAPSAPRYCSLGSVLGKLGRYEEALRAYEEAVKLNPNDAEAHYGVGWALCKHRYGTGGIRNVCGSSKLYGPGRRAESE
jgi:tetratricopeptide (TPR) repeat protein